MARTTWLTAAEADTWRAYRRMRALLDLQLARDLAADDLSDPDYDVLSTLSETPDSKLRLSDLAASMLWSRTRLSHQVARMQGRGLVDRVEAPEDGRGTVVVLSAEGRRVLEQAAPGHVRAVRAHFIDQMTPEQVRVLGEVAHAVVDHLSNGTSLHARSAPTSRRPTGS